VFACAFVRVPDPLDENLRLWVQFPRTLDGSGLRRLDGAGAFRATFSNRVVAALSPFDV